jgi:hypothetical protein
VNATLLSTLNVELLAEVIADPDNQRNAFGMSDLAIVSASAPVRNPPVA